ncbi:MAG: LPS export ABC transporter ATP-binding protein [Nitrospirota bacterium]|mgnify:CR=1 FL=1
MLEAVGLKKRYNDREVVRGVSLQLCPGEIVGFLGPNGAGKTTLFQMIAGLIFPSEGAVLFNNTDITTLPLYQRARLGLSYLPQEASIFRKMTVEENILAVLQLSPARAKESPLTDEQMHRRVCNLLEEFRLSHLSNAIAATLSGGERRRLEIARALANNPVCLLLDEPFSGIDPIVVIEIQKILFRLKEKGIGVFITDHNVDETLFVCDRAYIIHAGEILFSGTPSEISESEIARERYLGRRLERPDQVAV